MIAPASALFLALHGRQRRAAALRAARVQGLPVPEGAPVAPALGRPVEPPRAGPEAEPRRPSAAQGRRGPEREAKAAVAEVDRLRGARLAPPQLPRLRDLHAAPVLQAGIRRPRRPQRQPLPAYQSPDDP